MAMTAAFIRDFLHLSPIHCQTHGVTNFLNSGPNPTNYLSVTYHPYINSCSSANREWGPWNLNAVNGLDHSRRIDIQSLYGLSLKILNQREELAIPQVEELTMQALLSVGTSAGGRQMKAILAINPKTGEIKSGQVDGLEEYEYYIMKFEDDAVPTSEIEMAYHEMAVQCGIMMEKCQLLTVEGVNHFLTRRFDRKKGRKIHMQTLAAINPEATSYEELFDTCRELRLSDREIEELYLRAAFNVLANNTDDHNKNFSFLLEEGGTWKLSPAYDITFIFNRYGTGPETDHCLSIAGKYRDITRTDLIELAKENGIRNPEGLITRVAEVLKDYSAISTKYNIEPRWNNLVKTSLQHNLTKFGFGEPQDKEETITDSFGRRFTDVNLTINTKGNYEMRVTIDGKPQRRFIRPKMELYTELRNIPFKELSPEKQTAILEEIFPHP